MGYLLEAALMSAPVIASALFGYLCTLITKSRKGAFIAGFVPWLVLFVYLVYYDVDFWPFIQIIFGSLLAFAGVVSFYLTSELSSKQGNE